MEDNRIYVDVLPEEPKEKVCFTRRDWLALLGAAICAAGYAFGHPSIFVTGNIHLPGIGFTLSVWLILGLCLLRTGAKHLRQSLFPLAAALLLAASYGIFADEAMRLMNLPVLVGLTAIAAYALSGGRDLFTAAGLTESLRRLAAGTLPHLPAPFLALASLRGSGDRKRMTGLLLGFMLCVPVVGIAALLLCNADEAFRGALAGLIHIFDAPDLGGEMWNMVRFGGLTLLIFAFLYGLTRWKAPAREKHSIGLSPLTLGMVLAALSTLYAAFLCIQFGQLRAFSGSYANSARTGFFQLVLVALITMLVALPALTIHPDSPAIRILAALATLLTMGLLASAVWRMALYIRAYGWTLLRMVTLWGILAITAAMLAALVKCVRPRVQVCRALAVFAIATWILFNYINVDARIVEYNIAAFESGTLEDLDADYLANLYPESLSALRELADGRPSFRNALLRAEQQAYTQMPCWYDWSFSWRKAASAQEAVLGEWRLNSNTTAGVYPAYFAEGSTLTLHSDGTGELLSPADDEPQIGSSFTWTVDYDSILAECSDGHRFRLSLDGRRAYYSSSEDYLYCKYVR